MWGLKHGLESRRPKMHIAKETIMHCVCFQEWLLQVSTPSSYSKIKSPVPWKLRCSCRYLHTKNGKNDIDTAVMVILMVMLRIKVVCNYTSHSILPRPTHKMSL